MDLSQSRLSAAVKQDIDMAEAYVNIVECEQILVNMPLQSLTFIKQVADSQNTFRLAPHRGLARGSFALQGIGLQFTRQTVKAATSTSASHLDNLIKMLPFNVLRNVLYRQRRTVLRGTDAEVPISISFSLSILDSLDHLIPINQLSSQLECETFA